MRRAVGGGDREAAEHIRALEDRILGAALDPAEREEMQALVRSVLAEIVVPDVRTRPGP